MKKRRRVTAVHVCLLDEQVRVKQAAVLKERAQEREWLHREQVVLSSRWYGAVGCCRYY